MTMFPSIKLRLAKGRVGWEIGKWEIQGTVERGRVTWKLENGTVGGSEKWENGKL